MLEDVSWQQLESILGELGNKRTARLSYSNGRLEIMVPLPEHEKAAVSTAYSLGMLRS